jgi:hypothetical protein
MFSIKSVFESLQGSFNSMKEDFTQMEETLSSVEADLKEAEKNGTVTVKKETKPDGSITVTKTYISTNTKRKDAPATSRLEDALWRQLYSNVDKLWPRMATLLAFDGKHYSIGVIDVESRRFDVKGVGTSIADAVKDVERRYTVVR